MKATVENRLQRPQSCRPPFATVEQALKNGARYLAGKGIESARLDAELLLCLAAECRREELYLDYERPLDAHEEQLFWSLLQRRGRREPISYITEQKEFWSMDFYVTPDVLIPRPETELLVEVSLEILAGQGEKGPLNVLDLGTGSGIIAVTLAKERNEAEIWATDVSSKALKVSAANAARHEVRDKIRFLQGDLFEPLKERERSFQLIVSNPPYVRRAELKSLSPEVRDWEPRSALDGGEGGLDFYRRIISETPLYLADGCFLVLEIGADMARDVSRLIEQAGCYLEASICRDYSGKDRVLIARKG